MKRTLFISISLAVGVALTAIVVSCDKEGPLDPLVENNNHPIVVAQTVDLGITLGDKRILWADRNLGAATPYEYGNYYAWGEYEPKKDFSWASYSYANSLGTKFSKYCVSGMESWWDGSGAVDNLSTLKFSDDAARRALHGPNWRMPTLEEILKLLYTQQLPSQYKWELWREAIDEDEIEVPNIYGNTICGIRITRLSTGASIFLPAGGRINGKTPESVNELGYYWTSSLSEGDLGGPDGAYCLGFELEDAAGRWTIGRYMGALIRPVYEEDLIN